MNALKRVGGAVLLAGTVVLVMAGAAGAGATSTPGVKGFGTVSCAASGKVKFSPALSGSSTSTAATVSIALSACSGSNAGATVSGGHITGTITGTPAGDCASSGYATGGTLTVTYVVKSGHPALKPTTLLANHVRSFGQADFEGEVTGSTTGSFADNGSFLDLRSTQSSPCAAKWKGGAGTSTFEEG